MATLLEKCPDVSTRPAVKGDFSSILDVINDGAMSYRGIIPPESWKEPYMPESELRHEIESNGMTKVFFAFQMCVEGQITAFIFECVWIKASFFM